MEIIIVVAIASILLGFVGFNLVKAERNTTLSSTIQTLVSDTKSQQLKAMSGSTEGRTTSDSYGIYFQPTNYTLFHGMTYIPNDPSNFVVNADNTIVFSTTLPNNLLIFSKISGEAAGWVQGQNTITITNTTDDSKKIITVNQYGVITGVAN